MTIYDSAMAAGKHMRGGFALALLALLLGGCTGEADRETYRDIGVKSEPEKQDYDCPDGGRLLVEFSQDGTRALLRREAEGEAVELSAPSPSLTFVGDDINILFRNGKAHIEEVGAPPRTCVRR